MLSPRDVQGTCSSLTRERVIYRISFRILYKGGGQVWVGEIIGGRGKAICILLGGGSKPGLGRDKPGLERDKPSLRRYL